MKSKRENGEVVVEASIVVTIVLIFITLMLYIGMILYQQTLVTVMANQTASNLAQIYSNNAKDTFTGYIDADEVYQPVTYGNLKNEAYMNVISQKANVFAKYRLKSSKILATGSSSVEVEIVKKPNELLKSQIVIKIHDKYDLPLVSMFGTSGLVDFTATGRADCVDILEYINGVEAVGDPESSNVTLLPDSQNCSVIFVAQRSTGDIYSTVKVMKGESIQTSSKYTHESMPTNPSDGVHEFECWETESGAKFTSTTTVNEDIIVYGRWKCNVTLDATGGKVNNSSKYTFKVTMGKTSTLSSASRSGYSFKGWFTQKNGKGSRYYSNSTVFKTNVTLYAYWQCNHPKRYEASRSGTACTGGTIYYKCSQCNANIGTGWYPGSGHNWVKCNQAHSVNYFNGKNAIGGCNGYHEPGKYCESCKITHDKVYAYCVVCKYCGYTNGNSWCGNLHSGARFLPSVTPKNGHRKGW